MGQTYVDIEGMSATLTDMLTQITTLEGHIESYDTDASTSLGESSFRPEVERQLQGLKSGYQELIPELTKMQEKIKEIMTEYNLRASKIVSGGGTGAGVNTNETR